MQVDNPRRWYKPPARRYSTLAWLLRARYLVDADSWCEVKGQPMKPGNIARVIREKLR